MMMIIKYMIIGENIDDDNIINVGTKIMFDGKNDKILLWKYDIKILLIILVDIILYVYIDDDNCQINDRWW